MDIELGGGVEITTEERWYKELRAGRAFVGSFIFAPSAGQFAHIGLLNASLSGLRLLLYRVQASVGADAIIIGGYHGEGAASSSTWLENARSDGNAPNSGLGGKSEAAIDIPQRVTAIHALAKTPVDLIPRFGIELHDVTQRGFRVAPDTADVQLAVTFWWLEL